MRLVWQVAALCGFAVSCAGDSNTEVGGFMVLSIDPAEYAAEGESNFSGRWDNCAGTGGYGDFGPGMDVTIRDGDGKIVGATSTRSFSEADLVSEISNVRDMASLAKSTKLQCYVVFDPLQIPKVDFYEVEIGSRGSLTYSFEELKESGFWTFSTLGG